MERKRIIFLAIMWILGFLLLSTGNPILVSLGAFGCILGGVIVQGILFRKDSA